MVDIFDEVEEELRAERTKAFMKKYGGLLFGACVAMIGAAVGWQGWQWRQTHQDMEAAAQYLAAASRTEGGGVAGRDRAEAAAAFEVAAAGAPDGYRVLARLRAAALRAEAGDLIAASALWDQITADKSVDPLLRDLASLTWCLYHADQGDPALLEGRLNPLAAPGNAWRSLAAEQLAILDLRRGRTEEAKTRLKKLAEDTTAPAGVRGRASAILDRVGG